MPSPTGIVAKNSPGLDTQARGVVLGFVLPVQHCSARGNCARGHVQGGWAQKRLTEWPKF